MIDYKYLFVCFCLFVILKGTRASDTDSVSLWNADEKSKDMGGKDKERLLLL